MDKVITQEMIDAGQLSPELLGKTWAYAYDREMKNAVLAQFDVPPESTGNLSGLEMMDAVASLQMLGADDRIKDPAVWTSIAENGLDAGLGPVAADQLGLPDAIRTGAPASKILDDAAQLQTMGLELGDKSNWSLLDQYQQGKITSEQFVDAARKPGRGAAKPEPGVTGNQGGRGSQGSGWTSPAVGGTDTTELPGAGPISTPGAKGGRNNTGQGPAAGGAGQKTPNTPANGSPQPVGPAAGAAPGKNTPPGSTGPPAPAGSSGSQPPNGSSGATSPPGSTGPQTPPGSNGSGTGSDSKNGVAGTGKSTDAYDDDFTVEGGLEGTYVIVTSNGDGSYTATKVESDGNGNMVVLQTETYSDTDGDGTYEGDQGGDLDSKPKEGMYKAVETDEGTKFVYSEESNSTDSSGDSSTDDDSDSGATDSDSDKPADDDEYTPDPESGNMANLYNNTALIQSLYQMLSDERFSAGKGGKDSTPNPMGETVSGKKYPVDYKSMISRPVDGSSGASAGAIPVEAIQQILDPYKAQSGVIDPNKN